MDPVKIESNTQEYIPGAFNPLSSEVTKLIDKTVSNAICTIEYQKNSSSALNLDNGNIDVCESCKSSCDINKALCFLSLPPRYTTIRVNLLKITLVDAIKLLEKELQNQYEGKIASLPTVNSHHCLPEVLVIESNGMQSVEPLAKEVVVGRKCGSSVLRGAEVYAPGVVAASPHLKVGDPVAVFVDLTDTCLRGSKYFNGQKMFVGKGRARQTRKELFTVAKSRGVAVSMTEQIFNSPSLGNFNLDIFFLQNLPSVLCGHVLRPDKHAKVLDMCAAPGGKATHIASLMGNTGQVIAIDRTQSKVDQVFSNSKQLGLSNIVAYVYDSTNLITETNIEEGDDALKQISGNLTENNFISGNDIKSLNELSCEQKFKVFAPPYSCSSFKWILLDAPCSALGQRPQIQTRMNIKELQSFPIVQRNLLFTAVRLLKPGGKLVYSTCTIVVEENEKMVRWVLDKFPDVQLIDTFPKLGKPGLLHCGLDSAQCNMVQRFGPFSIRNEGDPSVDVDTIGFFIVAFKKRS